MGMVVQNTVFFLINDNKKHYLIQLGWQTTTKFKKYSNTKRKTLLFESPRLLILRIQLFSKEDSFVV